MKKIIFTLIALAFTSLSSNAQILNPGFEDLRSDGGVAKWGSIFLQQFPSPCGGYIFDSALYFSSTDAHSGARALELRNAKCGDEHFAGNVHLMTNDEAYFDLGAAYSGVSPKTFSFYYKFLPVGNDTAAITLQIQNENEEVIATTSVQITERASTYTLATMPIDYIGSGVVSRVMITIANSNGTSPANFGTRFLVDDIALTGEANAVTVQIESGRSIRCFPNPATSAVTFTADNTPTTPECLSLFNELGVEVYRTEFINMLTLDCTRFPKGVYHYQSVAKNGDVSNGSLVIR